MTNGFRPAVGQSNFWSAAVRAASSRSRLNLLRVVFDTAELR